MRTKTQPNESPAAQLETARGEHEAAEKELAALDVHAGTLDAAASRRRELQERVEIAKERLTLAQSRFDESEFARIEGEIVELQGDAAQIESELALAREQAERDLREHLDHDWLSGTGRYSTQQPAIHGLLGFCVSVSEVEQRRDAIHAAIRSRENRIMERKAARDREAAAARADARRRLIEGGAVEVALTPWRVVVMAGFVQCVADSLDRKFIPSAMPSPHHTREIHALLPEGTRPGAWCDSFHLESAEPLDPAALCPAMADAWKRSRGGAKAAR